MSETLIGSSDKSHAEYCDETMSETDNVYDLLQEVDQMSRRSCGPCTMHGYSRLATFCCRQCQYNYCSGCKQQHAKLVGHILERIETQSELPYSSLIYERDSESTTVDKQSKRTSKGYHGDMIETDFDYDYECVTQPDSESTTVDKQSKRTSKDVIETDFDCDYECVTQRDSESTTVDKQSKRTSKGYHGDMIETDFDYEYECVTQRDSESTTVDKQSKRTSKGYHGDMIETDFDYEYECVTQRDSESTTVDKQSKRTSKGYHGDMIETDFDYEYECVTQRDSESTTVDKQSKRTSKGYHGDMIETDFDYDYECVTQPDSESTTVDKQSKRTSKDVIETDFDCDYECVTLVKDNYNFKKPDSECTTVDRQTQRTATGYHSNVKEDDCDNECVTNEQNSFDVVVQETRAAKKWDVQGPHVLLVEAEGVSLLDVKSRDTLCTWLYPYIRRYGIKPSATCICLDFGQISATGQGVWEFKTPKYTAIHEQIKRSIVKYQGKLRYLEVKALYG